MRISTYIDICQYIVRIYQRVAFVENNFLFLTKGDKKMEQTVNQAIMECKAGKNREGNLNWIIQKFQPVICKYAGELYSLEYEDAVQELNEALIMAVVSIDVCNAEGQSIAYLVKGIKLKFYELRRKSIVEYEYRMHSEQIDVNTNITCTDDYSEIEWKLELKKLKDKSSPMECHIIDGMVWEISDVELADLLHVSRQYINRKRRQLMKRLKDQI